MYLIVCYDIVSDRRRARLLKRLKDYLPHVQKSVFEGEVADQRVQALRALIQKEIDPSEDTVRVYHQCGRCVPATEIVGTGVYIEREERDEVL